jgi:hypothetical protein
MKPSPTRPISTSSSCRVGDVVPVHIQRGAITGITG